MAANIPLQSGANWQILPIKDLWEKKTERTSGVLQGTLDMLVLKALAGGPMHGYDVAEHILAWSGDVLKVEEGARYPALHPSGAAWTAGKRMGRFGEQPGSQVLPDNAGGAEATGCGIVGLGTVERSKLAPNHNQPLDVGHVILRLPLKECPSK